MASVQVDLDVYKCLFAQGIGAGDTPSTVLRRLLLHTIEIDDDLVTYLSSLATSPGESIGSLLRRRGADAARLQ
jgi:negative regulator of replication initiation